MNGRCKFTFADGEVCIKKRDGVAKDRKYLILFDIAKNSNYSVHNLDSTNTLRGIIERIFLVKGDDGVMGAPVQPLKNIFKLRCSQLVQKLVWRVPPAVPLTYEQFISSRPNHKRTLYQRAHESLKNLEISEVDRVWKIFVKAEKLNLSNKPDPSPRIIYPRDPRYNIELGKFITAIEHDVYRSLDKLFGHRSIAKGRNGDERADMLMEAWNQFDKPVAIGVDAARFDQHTSIPALQMEHSVYNKIFKGDPELQKLLSWQLKNKGVAYFEDASIKLKVDGRRGSGDMNTALGNVIIMSLMIMAYIRDFNINSRVIDDGDDAILIVETRDLGRILDTIKPYFKDFGYKLKVEGIYRHIYDVEFCGSRLYRDGVHSTMIRCVDDCLDKDLISTKPIRDEVSWRNQCTSIGMCGSSLMGNVPIAHAFYKALMLNGSYDISFMYNSGMHWLSKNMEKRGAVTQFGRYWYWLMTDITPDEQIEIEKDYGGIRPSWEDGPTGYKDNRNRDIIISNLRKEINNK